ncbi:MAG: TetR family transcriptional regulator C-terminal domain-containing protein [Pseudomonadota bacterium]
MPKVVDHEERRNSIARAAMLEIAEGGIEDLRLKDVAARAGWTTGVLTHYFKSKEELLSEALKVTFREVVGEAVADAKDDRHDGYELMRRWLPSFPGRLAVSKAWIAFMGSAQFSSANRELFAEYYRLMAQEGHRRLEGIPLAIDAEAAVDMLQAFFDGLCTRVIMEPDAWPIERQEALLKTFIERLLRGNDG